MERPSGTEAPATTTAAESLLGLTLEGGWVVMHKQVRGVGATGGAFSVPYIAERDGDRAFVKALDYAKAFDSASGNTPEILQHMTAAFNFEKAVLERCREKNMRRVALPIASGSIEVPGAPLPLSRVDYLILEVAEHDVRAHIDASTDFDAAWRVRTLHQATSALRQLHLELIAHQDVKPSNFLVFQQGTKITDFGRSSRQGHSSPHDRMCCAGDKGYSAPELLYGYELPDWRRRRIGNDVFMLGSLLYFFFTGVSMTAAIHSYLHPDHVPYAWGGDYFGVLPYVRDAFDRALERFTEAGEKVVAPSIAGELEAIVRELCEPDPLRRGYPKYLGTRQDPLTLDPYVSRFNSIAARLEMRLKRDAPSPRR